MSAGFHALDNPEDAHLYLIPWLFKCEAIDFNNGKYSFLDTPSNYNHESSVDILPTC
jgi:hypothetical protein